MKPFRDERGFTTTSMVLSLLITLALVFSAAQVYRVNSASAEVQDVADAAALAAEGQVAEFLIIARFCDAVVLSLTLTGVTVTGLGIAALCTPPTAAASAELIEAGKSLLKARDEFADRAARVLDKLQEALPYLAAAGAANVARANNRDSSGASYLGIAVLVPAEGESLAFDGIDEARGLADDVGEQADEIREKARRAEEAAQEANRHKERAFAHDCGDNPAYCMYERASALAGMAGAENPLFESVDTWSFSIALGRAQAYYGRRAAIEAPADGSVDERARSALRARFYEYAARTVGEGYVRENADSFEASFPQLPANTSEMRSTALYTEAAYPITSVVVELESDDIEDGEGAAGAEAASEVEYVMHAWPGCPEVQEHGASATGSIADMESNGYPTCPVCGFTAASMGKVAAASTSISNGFEYHYRIVAEEAEGYERARREAKGPTDEVKQQAGSLLERLGEILKDAANKRLEAAPPGRYGAVAFVVNNGRTPAAGSLSSSFVSGGGSLGVRAAASAATLVDEGSDEGRNVINSALDGLRADGGAAVGVAGMVLDAWSWMLGAYASGQEFLYSAVEGGLDSLPLVGASGLGPWVGDKLRAVVEDAGLQPAQVGALKALIVNSGHVAARGGDGFAARYLHMKQQVIAHPLSSTGLFSSLLNDAEQQALDQIEGLGSSVQIASIELFGPSGPSLPVTVPLPGFALGYAASGVQGLFDRVRSVYADVTGVRVWE